MRTFRVKKNNSVINYAKYIGILIVMGSFFVWQRNTSITLGIRISEIKGRMNTLSEENKYLTMKIMDIMALNNLEDTAKRKLGLVAPKTTDVVVIEEGK